MKRLSESVIFFYCLVVIGTATEAKAQIGDSLAAPADVVAYVREAYRQLEYDRAATSALSALEKYERYSKDELVELNTILALIRYAQNDTDSSGRYFLSALSLDPELELDPRIVSPKILSFFLEVKSNRPSPDVPRTGDDRYVRYLTLRDARPAAALRTMAVPGWGQLYLGRRTRGRVLVGLWGLSISGTVVAHIARSRARSKYLDESDPARVPEQYDAFNRWHKVRGGFALAAAFVWTFSVLDVLSSGPVNGEALPSHATGFFVGPQGVSLAFQF